MDQLNESPRQTRRRLQEEAKQAESQELAELLRVQNRVGTLQNSIAIFSKTIVDAPTEKECLVIYRELLAYRKELSELNVKRAELTEARKQRANVGRLERPEAFHA